MNQATVFRHQSVERTPEITRIKALPRRTWTPEASERLAEMMTSRLKTRDGTMKLRPGQAISLFEAMECRGLFAPQRVGFGKTLVTLLLPLVLDVFVYAILLLPAALIEKTEVERRALSKHFRIPGNIKLMSYESLGLVQSADTLECDKPALIIADECHYLKNWKAGRTRRVARYMEKHPETMFAALSGTVMRSSLSDFAPMLRWALKDRAPVPRKLEETKVWADALDQGVNPLVRRKPAALFDLGPRPTGLDEVSAARQIFQSRLLETKGVVASPRSDKIACSLRVSALWYTPSKVTEEHFKKIRASWTTPDGWTFSEALEMHRYLRELAAGFHGIWDPRPPADWLAARRRWASFVRETLSYSRRLDTALQVVQAVDAGTLSPDKLEEGEEALREWRAIEPTFLVQPKPVWHDDTAIDVSAAWMKENDGIVWCKHVAFAERLAMKTGASYYGAEGVDQFGQSIVNVKAGRSIIASVASNSAGRNLQMFSRNLIVCPPTHELTWEQLMGRSHRDGQEADEVLVDVLLGCKEHHESVWKAVAGAKAAADTLGHDQKLITCDLAFPISIAEKLGPLWGTK
jgi:hypothetical protein